MDVDWKALVRQVAPSIGAALGGPGGAVAAKFLVDRLGVKGAPNKSNEDSIKDLVAGGDPETLLKIKQLDTDFDKFCQELGVRFEELAVDDRKSARKMMEILTLPQIFISAVFLSLYIAVLYLLIDSMAEGQLDSTPEWLRPVLIMLITLLTSEIPRIMSFWFGSSSGSKEKTGKLGGMAGGRLH